MSCVYFHIYVLYLYVQPQPRVILLCELSLLSNSPTWNREESGFIVHIFKTTDLNVIFTIIFIFIFQFIFYMCIVVTFIFFVTLFSQCFFQRLGRNNYFFLRKKYREREHFFSLKTWWNLEKLRWGSSNLWQSDIFVCDTRFT